MQHTSTIADHDLATVDLMDLSWFAAEAPVRWNEQPGPVERVVFPWVNALTSLPISFRQAA